MLSKVIERVLKDGQIASLQENNKKLSDSLSSAHHKIGVLADALTESNAKNSRLKFEIEKLNKHKCGQVLISGGGVSPVTWGIGTPLLEIIANKIDSDICDEKPISLPSDFTALQKRVEDLAGSIDIILIGLKFIDKVIPYMPNNPNRLPDAKDTKAKIDDLQYAVEQIKNDILGITKRGVDSKGEPFKKNPRPDGGNPVQKSPKKP